MAPSNTWIVVIPLLKSLTVPALFAWKVWLSFPNTAVSASVPSSTFTTVIESEKLPAVAVTITAVLLPKLAFVNVLVSPLPVRVTDGEVVNVVEFDMFCLFAVNVIDAGLNVALFLASSNIWLEADKVTAWALSPSSPVSPFTDLLKVYTDVNVNPPAVIVKVAVPLEADTAVGVNTLWFDTVEAAKVIPVVLTETSYVLVPAPPPEAA